MNHYENIDELIAKCLAEEASVLEKEIVNSWIDVSEENRKYYTDVEVIYKKAGKTTMEDKQIVSAAWEKFSERLPERTHKRSVLKRITVSFYSKAAVIIIMITAGYFIYKNTSQEEKDIILSSAFSSALNDTLPDGTFVSLSPKSTLTYPSSFNNKNRGLKLTGQAYFHVRHNQVLPFIVNAENVFIKDIGTSFTVKAHPADSTVVVFVEKGKVLFYSEQDPGISLTENETGIYTKTSASFRKKEDEDVNLNFQSGNIHTLSFEGASLRSVVTTLNKVYNVHLVLSCVKLESLKLTATFTEATVNPIVETIAETFNLSVTKTAGTILLDGQACKH